MGYVLFVVYGSLVPLDFQPFALDLAWQRFQHTGMLQLGIGSRADWIANGVLYIPVGLLLAERFIGRVRGAALGIALIAMLAASVTLAVGVEFLQLYFPPRTVSLNDIGAEVIGAFLGIAASGWLANRVRMLEAFRLGQIKLGPALLFEAFLFSYVGYALFPFDFVLSRGELAAKLSTDQWGWLIAHSDSSRFSRQAAQLGFEACLAVPVGFFLSRWRRWGSSFDLPKIALAGAIFGLVIEFAQLFLFSGVSQGASVISRMAGAWSGGWMAQQGRAINWHLIRPMLYRLAIPLSAAYLGAALVISGWFQRPWLPLDQALNALAHLHFLPFYYHYYTTESRALTSVMSIAALYLPLASLVWVRGAARMLAVTGIGVLAMLVETAKLFSIHTHADPTNVLIAGVTAWLAFATLDVIATPNLARSAPPGTPLAAIRPAAVWQWTSIGLLAAGAALWLAAFPVQPVLLAMMYAAVAAAVWFQPLVALLVVPAALPVLDLAPWSGRFYLDEFDWLLAIVITVALFRAPTTGLPTSRTAPALVFRLASGLILVSFAISTVRALLPWSPPDLNSFSSYLSAFNALRITKGVVWAALFGLVLRRLGATTPGGFTWLVWGMSVGLASTVGIILREKMMFGGLFNLDSAYRVTGPFSAIHIGGAYIECYLAVAAPFVIHLILHTRSLLLRLVGIAVLLASTFALMATISRNGFVAFGVAGALALLFNLVGKKKTLMRGVSVAVLALAAGAIAYTMLQGVFVQQRMSQIGQDLDVRTAHWQDGLAIRDDDVLTNLFGMGVGRYPYVHFWRSRETYHPSTHSLAREGDNTYLRIAPGNTVYVEQIVSLKPYRVYTLSGNVRAAEAGGTLGNALCEKWMLAAARCATRQHSPAVTQANEWAPFSVSLQSNELGTGTWVSTRPVKLSFFTNWGSVVDVDNIALTDDRGRNLIGNGDFESGLDRWFFATDEHLSWHIKSMPLAILFDQGWLGVLAFVIVILVAFASAIKRALSGNTASGTLLAALAGFLVTGIFDTLIDAPRFLLLFAMLVLLAALPAARTTD